MTPFSRRIAAVASIPIAGVLGQWCIPLGPAFPAPTNVAAHPLMRAAVANLTAIFDAAAAGGRPTLPFRANATYSSIGMVSAHDSVNGTIFQHHHTASGGGLPNSTARADADSIYRIASITKSFTVLALLQLQQAGRLSLEDPVTKWVPELAAAANASALRESTVELVAWQQVTLGALASQLSGIARDCGSHIFPRCLGLLTYYWRLCQQMS
jgi:CubicO group peptidase (beta-lactamase class C family)